MLPFKPTAQVEKRPHWHQLLPLHCNWRFCFFVKQWCCIFYWDHTTPTSSAASETSDSAAGRKPEKYREPRACVFLCHSEQLLLLLFLPLDQLEAHQNLLVFMSKTCTMHMEALNDIQVLKAISQNCTQVNCQHTTDKPISEWLVKTEIQHCY